MDDWHTLNSEPTDETPILHENWAKSGVAVDDTCDGSLSKTGLAAFEGLTPHVRNRLTQGARYIAAPYPYTAADNASMQTLEHTYAYLVKSNPLWLANANRIENQISKPRKAA